MGALAGIAFDGNRDSLVGTKMPHDVNDVASVLGAELDAELAANFAAAEMSDLFGWPEIGEVDGDGLRSAGFQSGAHLLGGNLQTISGSFINSAVGDVKVAGFELRGCKRRKEQRGTENQDQTNSFPSTGK
jgi:hypothetical protein